MHSRKPARWQQASRGRRRQQTAGHAPPRVRRTFARCQLVVRMEVLHLELAAPGRARARAKRSGQWLHSQTPACCKRGATHPSHEYPSCSFTDLDSYSTTVSRPTSSRSCECDSSCARRARRVRGGQHAQLVPLAVSSGGGSVRPCCRGRRRDAQQSARRHTRENTARQTDVDRPRASGGCCIGAIRRRPTDRARQTRGTERGACRIAARTAQSAAHAPAPACHTILHARGQRSARPRSTSRRTARAGMSSIDATSPRDLEPLTWQPR
jgi:hypothetical protein